MENLILETPTEKINEIFNTLSSNLKLNIASAVPFRRLQLLKLKMALSELSDEIQQAISLDLGLNEAQVYLSTVLTITSELEYALNNLEEWTKPKKLDTPVMVFPSHCYHQVDPMGIALIIGSWNYPLTTTLIPFISALAAGNLIVVKPSEMSINSSKILAKIVSKLDPRFYCCIEGAIETGKTLNKLPFDVIVFTGSPQVGRFVSMDASKNLTKLVLELGGKNPTIVDETANIDLTVKRIVNSKFLNCGQTCVSPDYVFLNSKVSKPFMSAIKAELVRVFGQDAEESKDYGRIINHFHTKRVLGLIGPCKDKVVFSLGQADEKTKFVPPTLILNPDMNSQLMKEEVFGPVLSIVEFESFDKVIEHINDNPKPLSMHYYGEVSGDNFKNLKERTRSGSLIANDSNIDYLMLNGGFGGVGTSGYGKIRGYLGFLECSHLKMVIERSRSGFLDISVRYGPSNPSKLRQFRFIGDKFGSKTVEEYLSVIKRLFGAVFFVLLVWFLSKYYYAHCKI